MGSLLSPDGSHTKLHRQPANLDVMAPVPWVEHRSPGIISHPATSRFVRHAAQGIGVYFLIREDFSSRSAKNLFHLSVHFVADREGMIVFSVRVKWNLRNPEAVLQSVGIDFDMVLRQTPVPLHTADADGCCIECFDLSFEPKTRAIQTRAGAGAHAATVSKLNRIPAGISSGPCVRSCSVECTGWLRRIIVVAGGAAGELWKESLTSRRQHAR